MSPPFSGLKSKPNKKPVWIRQGHKDCFLLHAGLLPSLLTLKMEAAFSSDTSVDFQWTPRRYIFRRENFLFEGVFWISKSYSWVRLFRTKLAELNEKPAVKLSVPLRNTSVEQVSCTKLIYTTWNTVLPRHWTVKIGSEESEGHVNVQMKPKSKFIIFLQKYCGLVWTGFIPLDAGTSGGFL
jgi:hypothetical protein